MRDWTRVCEQCGKKYTNSKDRSVRRYCSTTCAQKSTIGRKAPWKIVIGKDNHMWKGIKVSYRNLHRWVERHMGKPNYCEWCNQYFYGKKIHWANKSGYYKRDLSDWIRLCAKCHKKYDIKKKVKV